MWGDNLEWKADWKAWRLRQSLFPREKGHKSRTVFSGKVYLDKSLKMQYFIMTLYKSSRYDGKCLSFITISLGVVVSRLSRFSKLFASRQTRCIWRFALIWCRHNCSLWKIDFRPVLNKCSRSTPRPGLIPEAPWESPNQKGKSRRALFPLKSRRTGSLFIYPSSSSVLPTTFSPRSLNVRFVWTNLRPSLVTAEGFVYFRFDAA